MPAMSDAPLRGYNGRHEWFWEPDDEAHIYPLESLMDMYENSVGHNSTLILGITPDDQGLVPEADAKRMKEFGEEINRRYAHPIAKTSGEGNELVLELDRPQKINRVALQEAIEKGERVREFKIEGKVNGKWVDLYKGNSMGHKHIAQFKGQKVGAVKVRITKAVSKPILTNVAVY